MKNNKPIISICVPTYNGEKYLEEALNSILSQTFNDYEVIIVDDQSTDNTIDISKKFSEKDQRIHCYQNKKNLGLVGNWNKCIELARGEWIKFVFQDDLIAPTCIEELLAASTTNTWLAICRRDYIFEEGTSEETQHFYEKNPKPHQVFGKMLENDLTFIQSDTVCQTAIDLFGINCFGEPSATLIRKEAFARHGLFNPNLAMMCDTEYCVRLSIHHGFTYLNKSLASFRVHSGSTSAHHFSKRKYRIILDGIILMYEYAYNPKFTPIRKCMLRRDPPVDLNAILENKIEEARWIAIDAAHNPFKHDPNLLIEWNSLLTARPNIKQVVQNIKSLLLLKYYITHCILLIKYNLDRYISWRFKH